MADIIPLGVKYFAEGHEQVKQANRDVASTGREAEQAVTALEQAQQGRARADREAVTGSASVTRATEGVTLATTSAARATVEATRAMQGHERETLDVTRATASAAAANRDLAVSTAGATRAMRGFDLRGMSMQLSQVGQQTMASGNFIQALAIQLPDLALGFGSVGILAGVAAGALLPLAANMLGAGGEARTLDDELDRLGNTTRAMQDNTELLRMSWRELTAEFGSGAVAVRALTIAQTELQVSLARAELREHVDLFKEAASTYYATNNASRDYQNTLDRLVDTFGVSVAEARQLETLIQKVATSPFDEQEEALSQIVDFLAQAGVNLRDLPPALSLALSSMIEVARETERLEKAIADAEGSVDMAAKTTLSFAQNMERAYRAADSISGVDFKNLAEATRWGAGLWDGSEWINPPDMTPWTQPRSSFSRDGMSPEALTALARLEQASEKTFRVISDYRSPDENRAANGARDSQHMQGNAFDIDVSGMTPEQRAALIRIARREAGFGGVGVYQNSLHFDTGPTRAWGPSFGADSVPGWAFEATQTPRAGDAEATRAQAEAAREAEKAERDRERALDRSQNAYDRLRSSIDPAVAASVDFAAAQEVIREALENGQISAEEAAVAMAAVEREYQETLGDLASERVETMRSGFESLTSTLLRAAAAGDSVGEALRNFLLDAAIQAAARSLANTLTSLFSGGAGGGGGLLGSFVSSIFGGANAKGNVFDGGSVVAFARGGVVDSDTYFPMSGGRVGLMGEAGPEAIMPLTRGPDGKLGVHAQGGQAAQQQTATRVEVVPSPYFDVRVTQVSAPLVQSGMRASAQQFGNIASGYNERGTT